MIRALAWTWCEIAQFCREYEAAVCDGLLVWALPTLCVLMGRIRHEIESN